MRMKYLFIIILILTGFSLIFSCTGKRQSRINSFNEIKKDFSDPPVEFRSVPLTVWNDDITEEKIENQINMLHSQGIGGIMVHPRYGLINPYLSDEYFSLYQFAYKKAKELGMNMWLYDENGYPSGFAGGYVQEEMPEAAGKALVPHRYNTLPVDIKGEIAVVLKLEGSDFVDITDRLEEEKSKTGKYYIFELIPNPPKKYVDLLTKGVTEKFLDITVEKGYKKYLGQEFGKMVLGIFQDEADISPLIPNTIKWTPDLFSEFEKMWGYDLRVHLPSLLEQTGEWRKIRHNYYAALLHLFIERWAKVYYQYCEDNNLKLTGHYWENWWPRPARSPDNMAMYAWAQMPGIDILDNVYSDDSKAQREKASGMGGWGYPLLQVGNVRIVKELSSVANQMNRSRTLSETYGRSGWDLRFEDMKRIGDWEYALGVNFLTQHLFQMTLKGARKQDNPPSFYHEPYWKFYHYLADYFARLSLVLSSGEQINKILVIEPTSSMWMYYFSPTQSEEFQSLGEILETRSEKYLELGDEFQEFVTKLSKLHVDYDLGCENIIKDIGKIENGKFVVGERTYDILVLPPGLENLNSPTVSLLEKYLKEGGKVISFVDAPKYIDGAQSDKISKTASQNRENWLKSGPLNKQIASELFASENFQILFSENINNKLFHHRRQFKDGEILFLANSNIKEYAAGKVKIKGKSVLKLDLMTGDIVPYPAVFKDNSAIIDFNLPPVGSLLLYVGSSASENLPSSREKSAGSIIEPTGSLQIERIKPNSLTIDYCDYKIDGKTEKDIYTKRAQKQIYKHYGFKGNPWYGKYQFKSEIIDKNKFPEDSGFEAVFYFDVEKGVDKSSLQAVVEQPDIFNVSVNGNPVKPLPNEHWLDYAFSIFDIGKYVKTGKNQIVLNVSPFSVLAELDDIYILGNFDLSQQKKGWKIIPETPVDTGRWDKQGLPFYSDGVAYGKTYNIKSLNKKHILKLGKWLGTVAEVQINGKDSGIIAFPPYSLDISDKLKQGENKIKVVVYGSLNNQLGPHHYTFRGRTGPSCWDVAPEKQPAGNKYFFIGYGLFDDFSLIEK